MCWVMEVVAPPPALAQALHISQPDISSILLKVVAVLEVVLVVLLLELPTEKPTEAYCDAPVESQALITALCDPAETETYASSLLALTP